MSSPLSSWWWVSTCCGRWLWASHTHQNKTPLARGFAGSGWWGRVTTVFPSVPTDPAPSEGVWVLLLGVFQFPLNDNVDCKGQFARRYRDGSAGRHVGSCIHGVGLGLIVALGFGNRLYFVKSATSSDSVKLGLGAGIGKGGLAGFVIEGGRIGDSKAHAVDGVGADGY